MNYRENVASSQHFYRFGAGCCVYDIFAQLIQEIAFRFGINDSATGATEILQRLMPLDQCREVLLLLGFSFIPILAAYAGVALRRFRVRPEAAVMGFAFSCLFVGTEASIRSIDLFLISRTWAVQYQAAASEAIRHAIAARIQIWDESVGALYFSLLAVHLLSSVCFTIATWDRDDRWNRIVALGFVVSAIFSGGRKVEGYIGQTRL